MREVAQRTRQGKVPTPSCSTAAPASLIRHSGPRAIGSTRLMQTRSRCRRARQTGPSPRWTTWRPRRTPSAISQRKRPWRSAGTYYAMIAELDAMVGEMMDTVDALGLTDSTYFIYISDHGEMNLEHGQYLKNSLYESSARVAHDHRRTRPCAREWPLKTWSPSSTSTPRSWTWRACPSQKTWTANNTLMPLLTRRIPGPSRLGAQSIPQQLSRTRASSCSVKATGSTSPTPAIRPNCSTSRKTPKRSTTSANPIPAKRRRTRQETTHYRGL